MAHRYPRADRTTRLIRALLLTAAALTFIATIGTLI